MKHQILGIAKWIGCKASRRRRVSKTVALEQLAHCRVCPSAQVRHIPGLWFYWLSCGPPGKDRTSKPAPTCGCALARLSVYHAKRGPGTIAENVRAMCSPWGKTKCKAACDQGKF